MALARVYRKKIKPVQAVRVTEENFDAAAAWCDGVVFKDSPPFFIRVLVNPDSDNPYRMARIGNYIIKNQDGSCEVVGWVFFEQFFEEINSRGEPVPPYQH